MNRRVLAVLLAAAVLLTAFIALGLLWGRQELSDMQELCMSGAGAAAEHFRAFSQTGEESAYWYGVAEFRSFMKACRYLNADQTFPEYTWCNSVYGYLVLSPEQAQPYAQDLALALEQLARNPEDPNGFAAISRINNALIHGE